jgi:hypothetical protein
MDSQDSTNNQTDQNDSPEEKPRKYKPRGFNERIGDAELLAEAMDKNKEELSARGGGEEFVNLLKTTLQAAKALNTTQEENKATLKESTQTLGLKMDELDKLVSDGYKIVKMVVNQKRWVEFGITTSR